MSDLFLAGQHGGIADRPARPGPAELRCALSGTLYRLASL